MLRRDQTLSSSSLWLATLLCLAPAGLRASSNDSRCSESVHKPFTQGAPAEGQAALAEYSNWVAKRRLPEDRVGTLLRSSANQHMIHATDAVISPMINQATAALFGLLSLESEMKWSLIRQRVESSQARRRERGEPLIDDLVFLDPKLMLRTNDQSVPVVRINLSVLASLLNDEKLSSATVDPKWDFWSQQAAQEFLKSEWSRQEIQELSKALSNPARIEAIPSATYNLTSLEQVVTKILIRRRFRDLIAEVREQWTGIWASRLQDQAAVRSDDEPVEDIWRAANLDLQHRIQSALELVSSEFPVTLHAYFRSKALKTLEERKQKWAEFMSRIPDNFFPQPSVIQSGDVQLESADLLLTYDQKLQTRLIHKRPEMIGDGNLPLTVLHHGLGTSRSSATSYMNIISWLTQMGHTNVVAPDTAPSGLALSSVPPSPAMIAANLHHLSDELRQRQISAHRDINNPSAINPSPPLIKLTRSCSALFQHAQDFYFPEHAAHVCWLMSYSNPITGDEVSQRIYAQADLGLRKIDPRSMKFADIAHEEFIDLFREMPFGNRKVFEFRQIFNGIIMAEADDDYGYEGPAEMHKLRDQYFPLAALYIIPDHLRGTLIRDYLKHPVASKAYEQFWFPRLEATHMIIGANHNVTKSEAEEIIEIPYSEDGHEYRIRFEKFGFLPMELWPRIANQGIELLALTYQHLDQLIELDDQLLANWDLNQLNGDINNEQIRAFIAWSRTHIGEIRDYRQWYLNNMAPQGARNFLEAHALRNGLKLEDLDRLYTDNDHREFFSHQLKVLSEYHANALSAQEQRGMLAVFETANRKVPSARHLDSKVYAEQDLTARFQRVAAFGAAELARRKELLKGWMSAIQATPQETSNQ